MNKEKKITKKYLILLILLLLICLTATGLKIAQGAYAKYAHKQVVGSFSLEVDNSPVENTTSTPDSPTNT